MSHMYDVALVALCVIVFSFLSFSSPFFLDSIPAQVPPPSLCTRQKCKTRKPQPYVLMKWKIIYSDLFWDHDQLLSCWALRSTITFEGKGLTYSPLVSYVFSVLHTRSTHQYLFFFSYSLRDDARVLATIIRVLIRVFCLCGTTNNSCVISFSLSLIYTRDH